MPAGGAQAPAFCWGCQGAGRAWGGLAGTPDWGCGPGAPGERPAPTSGGKPPCFCSGPQMPGPQFSWLALPVRDGVAAWLGCAPLLLAPEEPASGTRVDDANSPAVDERRAESGSLQFEQARSPGWVGEPQRGQLCIEATSVLGCACVLRRWVRMIHAQRMTFSAKYSRCVALIAPRLLLSLLRWSTSALPTPYQKTDGLTVRSGQPIMGIKANGKRTIEWLAP